MEVLKETFNREVYVLSENQNLSSWKNRMRLEDTRRYLIEYCTDTL